MYKLHTILCLFLPKPGMLSALLGRITWRILSSCGMCCEVRKMEEENERT